MIENKLTRHELNCMFRPFLRAEPLSAIIPNFEEVWGLSIKKRDDIVCQNKFLITYEGYRIDILDLRQTAPGAASVHFQFKTKKKWWHGVFKDQNATTVNTIQNIFRAEIPNLTFTKFKHTVPTKCVSDTDDPQHLVYFHDSQAFNGDWKAGWDISPLLIAPDCHHGNCFIEVQFNSAAYQRMGKTTSLKDDWRTVASTVSEGIERDAKDMLGIE